MKKLAIIAILLASCTTEDFEEVKHYYSTRAEATCDELTYTNGVYQDSCSIKAGGQFSQDIVFEGNNGATFNAFSIDGDNESGMILTPVSTQVYSNSLTGGTAINAASDGIQLASSGNVSIKISNQGVEIKAAGQNRIFVTTAGRVKFFVPSNSVGLSSGDVYRNGSNLQIVP